MDETTKLFLEKCKEYFSYEKILREQELSKEQIEDIYDAQEALSDEIVDMIELEVEE